MGSSIRSNGLFPRRWEEEEEEEVVHVLAVDDSVVDRKVIERLLKITSCKVTTVESGWRALQYLGLDTPPAAAAAANHHHDFVNGLKVDLIITDYCMPGMTGYELLKKIKGSPTFRQVPVVIMSSENLVPRIHRCLEEGAEDFIVKPVKLSDVKRLKDYMFGDNSSSRGTTTTNHINNQQQEEEEEEDKTNKRKLQQMMSSPTMSPSTSLSPSSTPPMSPPFSPSQLQSPTSNSDDDDDHHHV